MTGGERVTMYALCDETGVRYVGRTTWPLARRVARHLVDQCRRAKGEWVRGLERQGQKPRIVALEEVSVDEAVDAERRQIMAHRERGGALLNGPLSHGSAHRSWTASVAESTLAGVEVLAAEDGVSRAKTRDALLSETVPARLREKLVALKEERARRDRRIMTLEETCAELDEEHEEQTALRRPVARAAQREGAP